MKSDEGNEKMTAREMTAEIDRITENAAHGDGMVDGGMARDGGLAQGNTARVNAVTESETKVAGLDREQAGGIGNKILEKTAIFSNEGLRRSENANVAQLERQVEDSTNLIKREVEIENGYAREAMEGESAVGAESVVQAKEWQRDDDEDIANEQGLNGRYVKNLMDRNRKRITNETIEAVDKLIADNDCYPGRLAREASKARTDFLAGVFNRILGQRN